MEIQQPTTGYVPSIPYLIFLQEAIKGGYQPTPEEKSLLKKYGGKRSKSHPKSGLNHLLKEVAVQLEEH